MQAQDSQRRALMSGIRQKALSLVRYCHRHGVEAFVGVDDCEKAGQPGGKLARPMMFSTPGLHDFGGSNWAKFEDSAVACYDRIQLGVRLARAMRHPFSDLSAETQIMSLSLLLNGLIPQRQENYPYQPDPAVLARFRENHGWYPADVSWAPPEQLTVEDRSKVFAAIAAKFDRVAVDSVIIKSCHLISYELRECIITALDVETSQQRHKANDTTGATKLVANGFFSIPH